METVVNFPELKKYYAGKRVFVTGNTGFKGAWLTAILHTLGATVKGYALAPAYPNGLFSLQEHLRLAECVIADIRDKPSLQKAVLSFQPHYIFHLAAQPLVRRSYSIPAETFEVNVVGTANLLETLEEMPQQCSIVVITTDKVYENKETNVLYKESDTLGGYDPYSASKACTELVVSSFRNSFFHPAKYHTHKKAIASARAGNVIGGGDWSTDRIVPDIIRSLQAGAAINVRNPIAVRPWQHVLEPLCGYLLLAAFLNDQPGSFSKAYNFGPIPQDHLTVETLVEQSIIAWGAGNWKDASIGGEPHEAGLLQLDINRAIQELQWKPKLDAASAIKWTIDWYKQPIAKQSDFSFTQINNYLSL